MKHPRVLHLAAQHAMADVVEKGLEVTEKGSRSEFYILCDPKNPKNKYGLDPQFRCSRGPQCRVSLVLLSLTPFRPGASCITRQ